MITEKKVEMRVISSGLISSSNKIEHKLYAAVSYKYNSNPMYDFVLVEIATLVTESYTDGVLSSVVETTDPSTITAEIIETAVDAALQDEEIVKRLETSKKALLNKMVAYHYPNPY